MTPNNPEWVTSMAQNIGAGIQKFGNQDPYSLVAPASDLEKQAAVSASKLGQGIGGDPKGVGGDDWFSSLLSQSAPQVASASLLDNLQSYYNPYRNQVTDAAMADFEADAGRTRAAQDLALAGEGAFGGSGAALTKSLTEGELSRARNTQMSKLLSDMFTTSAGLAGQDADRRQQASAANAQMALENRRMQGQLALERENSNRSNIAAQAALGQQLRGIDQAYRNAPMTQLGNQIDMFSGLPLQLFQGQTTNSNGTSSTKSTQTPSFLDVLGQVAQIGSAVATGFAAG
jgi:hypothetical protein